MSTDLPSPGDEKHSRHVDRRQNAETNTTSNGKQHWWQPQRWDWLEHFTNKRDLKILTRCSVAIWLATILIFIQPVLEDFGQATFLAALTLYSAPPDGNLFIYCLTSFSLLLGMCVAWAWGILTMYAAQAARPDDETRARLQSLEEAAVEAAQRTGESVAWEAQVLGHKGYMLDIRVTSVYWVMCCLFIYMVSRLRCWNPKFTLFQIFSIILIDMWFLGGPSLPGFMPTISAEMMKPSAVGVALGIVCSLLLFPQSTSYVVLDTLEKLIGMSESSLAWTRDHLAEQPPEMGKLKSLKGGMIGAYVGMEPLLGLLPLDVSRCRWNTDDVTAMQEGVRKILTASLALLDLHIGKLTIDERRMQSSTISSVVEKGGTIEPGHRQKLDTAELLNALNSPSHGLTLERARTALQGTTADIIEVSLQSLRRISRCVHMVNANRWFYTPSQEAFDSLGRELEGQLAALREERITCTSTIAAALRHAHNDLFQDNGKIDHDSAGGSPALLAIINSMVVEEYILAMVRATEQLLEQALHLTRTRRAHRIWFPTQLRYAVSWVLNKDTTVPMSRLGRNNPSISNPDKSLNASVQSQVKEAHQTLRNIRENEGLTARKRKRSLIGRVIIATIKWLTDDAGMYSLRMVLASIAAGVPAVVMHTSGFFVREMGVWVVVTAQTSVMDYMADFTFSFVTRIGGSLIGGLLGLANWYIGSGSGTGNPYGLGASSILATIPLTYIRIFWGEKGLMATVLAGATYCLVIGYSYDHHHLKLYGLPGMGWTCFWKRMVEVFIGFAIAFLVQIFPTPPSGTRHICTTLANSIRTLSDQYALLLSHWGKAKQGKVEQNKAISSVGERIHLDLSEILLMLEGPIDMLKLEITSSPFDADTLLKVRDQCHDLSQNLHRLLGLLSTMPIELQNQLVNSVGILDDRLIGDVMAVLGLVEQSLRTGCPLPERTPAPLVRIFFDSWRVRTPSVMLSIELIQDENYRRYCVGVSAYLQMLSTIDDLVLILKGTLGECHVVVQHENV